MPNHRDNYKGQKPDLFDYCPDAKLHLLLIKSSVPRPLGKITFQPGVSQEQQWSCLPRKKQFEEEISTERPAMDENIR